MFSYWIQKHDYASDEVENVSLKQAVQAYRAFDWEAELAAFVADDDARNCPPGIGYHNGYTPENPEAMLLHICPQGDGTAFFNFHYRVRRKAFGLLRWTDEEIHHVESFPRERVPELVRMFFDGRTGEILGIRDAA